MVHLWNWNTPHAPEGSIGHGNSTGSIQRTCALLAALGVVLILDIGKGKAGDGSSVRIDDLGSSFVNDFVAARGVGSGRKAVGGAILWIGIVSSGGKLGTSFLDHARSGGSGCVGVTARRFAATTLLRLENSWASRRAFGSSDGFCGWAIAWLISWC